MTRKKQQYRSRRALAVTGAAAVVLTLALAAAPASAQRGGGGGGGRQGGFAGGGQQRMARPSVTLAEAPVSAMTPYFGLTAEQATRIEEIQKAAREQVRTAFSDLRNPPDAAGGNANGAAAPQFNRQNREQMRTEIQARVQKVQEDREKTDREVRLVLTVDQRGQIASFLRYLELFRQVGLPPELIKALDLTTVQKTKLIALIDEADASRQQQMQQMIATMRQNGGGRQRGGNQNGAPADGAAMGENIREAMRTSRLDIREKALALLTPEQRTMVEAWEKQNPRTQQDFGGRGNRG